MTPLDLRKALGSLGCVLTVLSLGAGPSSAFAEGEKPGVEWSCFNRHAKVTKLDCYALGLARLKKLVCISPQLVIDTTVPDSTAADGICVDPSTPSPKTGKQDGKTWVCKLPESKLVAGCKAPQRNPGADADRNLPELICTGNLNTLQGDEEHDPNNPALLFKGVCAPKPKGAVKGVAPPSNSSTATGGGRAS